LNIVESVSRKATRILTCFVVEKTETVVGSKSFTSSSIRLIIAVHSSALANPGKTA
jgi:hypothetical protein